MRKKDRRSRREISGHPSHVWRQERVFCVLSSKDSRNHHLLKLLCRQRSQVPALWGHGWKIQGPPWDASLHGISRCLGTLHGCGIHWGDVPKQDRYPLSGGDIQGTGNGGVQRTGDGCVQRCCSIEMTWRV